MSDVIYARYTRCFEVNCRAIVRYDRRPMTNTPGGYANVPIGWSCDCPRAAEQLEQQRQDARQRIEEEMHR